MEPSLLRGYFYTKPFLLIRVISGIERRNEEVIQLILYIVKSYGGVTVGTYIGSDLYYYRYIV